MNNKFARFKSGIVLFQDKTLKVSFLPFVPFTGQIVRSLLEAEKWELALEIATKSGLPRNSVIAAWGMACLKAGCFKQAREKFAHCFKSSMNVYMEAGEDCEYGKEAKETSEPMYVNRRLQGLRYSERSISMSSMQSDGRPRTNPPLLNEIVSILEDMNYPVNQQLLNKAETMTVRFGVSFLLLKIL